MNSVWSNNLCLKYLRYSPSDWTVSVTASRVKDTYWLRNQ